MRTVFVLIAFAVAIHGDYTAGRAAAQPTKDLTDAARDMLSRGMSIKAEDGTYELG
jgi:hypothetical protein